MADATTTLIAAHATSPETRRILKHASRLLTLNGHADSAEEIETLLDLGRAHNKAKEHEAKMAKHREEKMANWPNTLRAYSTSPNELKVAIYYAAERHMQQQLRDRVPNLKEVAR